MLDSAKMVGFLFTTNYEKAKKFYHGKLGFRFIGQDEFALVVEVGGHMIRISRLPKFTPAQGTVLGWEVSDVEAAVAWLGERGVSVEKYPWVDDPRGIWTAPGGSKVAWFKDPDGNVLSVSKH